MATLLQRPELMLDYLVPAGSKFPLASVARILSDSEGKPVSIQTIRNGLDSGALFGSRFNFSAQKKDVERHRVAWLSREDVLLVLLEARTAPEEERLNRILQILNSLSCEGLNAVLAHATALRSRKTAR